MSAPRTADGGPAAPLLARLQRREHVRARLSHESDPRPPELPDAVRERVLSWRRRVGLLLAADRARHSGA